MQVKLIFTTKVLHLASFRKWEFLEIGNGRSYANILTVNTRVMSITTIINHVLKVQAWVRIKVLRLGLEIPWKPPATQGNQTLHLSTTIL